MYNNAKRKPKPNTSPRTNVARPKGNTDKNMPADGIYHNARFLQATTSLMGCVMLVQVKNGDLFEGIFQTCSPDFEIVLDMVHKVDNNDKEAIPKEEDVTHKMIFKPQDIVMMSVANVDLEYASKDSFATDSAISKFNGKVIERELEPWDDSSPVDAAEDALSTTNVTEDANGWDAVEMFKTNKDKYGVKSTYDNSLAGYTVPLEKQDTEEYRNKEERAKKIANEIENSQVYKQRVEMENGDEEEIFSAVVRPSNESNSTPKYNPVNKRKSNNKNFPRSPASQPAHINNSSNLSSIKSSAMPQRTGSPAHQNSRNHVSQQQSHPVQRSKPNYGFSTQHANQEPAKPNNDAKNNIGEKKPSAPATQGDKTDTVPKPQPSEKPKSQEKSPAVSHKSSKSEEIAGLKKFSNDFDIDSHKAEQPSSEPEPPKKPEKSTEAEDKLAATVKNSNLNPNAKEFVFNPNARSFTPRSPQTTTPPTRPQATQSPIIPAQVTQRPFGPHQVLTHPVLQGQQQVVPASPQQYIVTAPAPVSVSITPSPFHQVMNASLPTGPRYRKVQIAAATGQPLLAPAAAATGPAKFTVPYPSHQGMVTAGPGAPQPAVMSYHHQVYMGPRVFNHPAMTMVPTSPSVSAVNYDQHGHNSTLYCTTSLPGHQTPNGGQQSIVSIHGMVNHSTPPIQSQAATPAGSGVHPSPSPVHHQASTNQPNGVPPQSVVFHPAGQIPPPPAPGPHQLQPNAPNQSGNGHQQAGNPSQMHISHGNPGMPHGNQHSVTYQATGAAQPHMLLLPQGTGAGTHPQPIIHTSSTHTLQQASHIPGPNNPGVQANTVIPHHPNPIPVIQAQGSAPLHYIQQPHNQPTAVYPGSQ